MSPPRPHKAPKKPTNLSIDSELLAQARQLNINLSATLEHALKQEVRTAQQKKWLSENQSGLDACNELADKKRIIRRQAQDFLMSQFDLYANTDKDTRTDSNGQFTLKLNL